MKVKQLSPEARRTLERANVARAEKGLRPIILDREMLFAEWFEIAADIAQGADRTVRMKDLMERTCLAALVE